MGMKQKHVVTPLLILLIALLALTACGTNQKPIPIFVTSTPQPVTPTQGALALAPPMILPTASPTPPAPIEAPAPTSTRSPSLTYGPVIVPGETIVLTTPTGGSPQPPVTGPFGPIVGPDHTLVPTETRLPPTMPSPVQPTAGPSPTPGPGLQSDLMGIQIHPHIDSREFDTVLAHARNLGMSWIKYQLNWSLLESAPGQYTELFYMLRLYIQESHRRGFKVMVSVAKAPGWSRTPGSDGIMHSDGPPDDPQALARFLGGMLESIGVDVAGMPYIDAIEVWNEPNLQREWYGQPLSGESYMRYFRPAFSAIREFSPHITIITAAPAPTGDSQWSTNDRTWLQQLYNAGLAQYAADIAVGVHPYGWANPPDARCCSLPSRGWDDQPQFFFLDTIEDYRSIMVANGHGVAKLWATEFGWATFEGMVNAQGHRPADPPDTPYFSHITQWQQAEFTLRAFYLAQEHDFLGPMILWNLNFATIPGAVDRSDPQSAYGTVDSRWQPRPVYTTILRAPKS